jgi:hypothetical protein
MEHRDAHVLAQRSHHPIIEWERAKASTDPRRRQDSAISRE